MAGRTSRYQVTINDLDPAAEPRLRAQPTDSALKADHPFFWAGYMLVDTGVGAEAK